MTGKLTLAGSAILLAASLGQAVAGETIADKRYWPNQTKPSTYRYTDAPAFAQQIPIGPEYVRRNIPEKVCTYEGGPKSGVKSCR